MNVTSFSATPSTTAAAAHPNFSTSIRLSYSNATDDVRAVQTFLPPGLIGNPRNVASCTISQLHADACPAGSKIGTTSSIARAPDNVPLLPPTTSTGDVYNVTPTGSELARIGLVVRPLGGLLGKLIVSGEARIRIPGDFGLIVTFNDLPRTLPALNGGLPIPVQVLGLDLTLFGNVAGKSFMTNPTSCIPAGTGLAATSYQVGTPVTSFSSFTPTDCANVPFDPTIGFQYFTNQANTTTALLAAIFVPANDQPRAQAHIKDTISILPQGTTINFAALPNIGACTDAQLNVNSADPPACPANSKIGQTAIVSPATGVVTGDVFFATGTAQNPLRLFITARITPTQTAKFIIVNSFTPAGGIRADLSNLPQVPQTQFVLGFNGGPNGLIKSPATCGLHYGSGIFTPWSGGPTKFNFAPIRITRQANGTPCPAAAAAEVFKPNLSSVLGDG